MRYKYIGNGEDSPKEINFMGLAKFTLNGDFREVHDDVECKIRNNKCFIAEMPIIDVNVDEIVNTKDSKGNEDAEKPVKRSFFGFIKWLRRV